MRLRVGSRTLFRGLAPWIFVALIAIAGCAAPQRFSAFTGSPLAGRPRVALLPLENLSGNVDAADALTHVFFTELAATQLCELADMGDVQRAMRRIRIRSTGSPTSEQVRQLGDSLRVKYVLCGTLLEQGSLSTSDGNVPALSAAFKLLEVPLARVIWGKMLTLTGEDHATVFGWGLVRDPNRLASELAVDLIKDLRRLAVEPKPEKERGNK